MPFLNKNKFFWHFWKVVFLFQDMWVYDEQEELMKQQKLTFVPGLYKIFDEILGTYIV